MIKKCPKCGSEDIKIYAGFIECKKCGYDEGSEFEEGRSTQKGKTKLHLIKGVEGKGQEDNSKALNIIN